MSDEMASRVERENQASSEGSQGRSVTLSITMHPNGQMEFHLPSNKVLAHGLLGAASEQLTKIALVADAQHAAAVQKSSNGMNGFLKRMGKGG